MVKRVAVAVVILASLAATARAGNGVDLLRYAPDDASFVLVVDVAAARTQPAFATLRTKAPLDMMLSTVSAAPDGIRDDLETIAFAMTGAPGDGAGRTVTLQGPVAMATWLSAHLMRQGPVRHAHGADYVTRSWGGHARLGGVVVSTRDRDIATTLSAARKAPAGPATLRALARDVDTGATAWAMFALSGAQQQAVASRVGGAKLLGITFAVRLADAIAYEVRFVCADEASAQTLFASIPQNATLWRDALKRPELAALVGLDVRVDGTHLEITGTASPEDFARLISAIPGAFATPAKVPAAPATTAGLGNQQSASAINCDDVLAGKVLPPPGVAWSDDPGIGRSRITGNPQIRPPDEDMAKLARSAANAALADVGVCLDATGAVSWLGFRRKSGLRGWDRRICEQVRDWRYQPYVHDGHPIDICTMVRFYFQQNSPPPAAR